MEEIKLICRCGCGEEIIPRLHHKYYPPIYKRGHCMKGKTLSVGHRNNMKGKLKHFDSKFCVDCGNLFIPKSSRSKWCDICSKRRRNQFKKDYEKNRYLKNPERNREKNRIRVKEEIKKYRNLVLSALGGRCTKCGFSDWRALQVDHIFGGGNKERGELHLKGLISTYYKHVLKNLSSGKYQLLCANCNWIKRFENNEVRNGKKQTPVILL